jgi:DNA-directed RNA polymerase subunit beta'
MRPLIQGGETIERLAERILGRTVAEDVIYQETGEILYPAGTLLDESSVEHIEAMGIDEVKVRSPLTCETRFGLCAKCYGRDLGRGHLVNVGEAVGIIAAQSIGEPGTQLTMRTFHIGGAASRQAAASQIETKVNGKVIFSSSLRFILNQKGEKIVISRNVELYIQDDSGRERERHRVPYGATLLVEEGSEVKGGQILAQWDPLARPVVAEHAGIAKLVNVEEGVTVTKQVDEITGLSAMVVIENARSGQKSLRPQIQLLDDDGNPVPHPTTGEPIAISLQTGAVITVKDGQRIYPGDILARIPQESGKTRDITGGLPRVAELLEARVPKDAGMLAEVTGTLSFGKDTKGKQRLIITDLDGVVHEFLVPKDKHVLVHDGQVVQKGELLVDGPPNPHDILRLRGLEALARYTVDEVQDVYRLQGVRINDKHIEVVVRQMIRRVEIKDPGNTEFMPGEQIDRFVVLNENDRVIAAGGMPATYEPLLLGITKASLSTDSFISAASFQETTRVLTEAAILGKRDELRGLKENVIVGRLIPAGTGFAYHETMRKRRKKGKSAIEDVFGSEAPGSPHELA